MLGFLSRFVDSNDRELHRIEPLVESINALEPEMQEKTDAEIRELIAELREDILAAGEPEEPSDDELHSSDLERRRELARDRRQREHDRVQEAMDKALPEVFAAAREAMRRTLGMRHFDVQLLGGVVLHQGKIAEMKTGEGKTFVPTLAAVLNALTGHGVHVVTVNDYLARRDAQWMGPVFHFLGLSVGIITGSRTSSGQGEAYVFEPGYPTSDERLLNLRPCARKEAYEADITYGTNNEFGFDYLRDNMVVELDQRVQRERYFAIVDEVDNILIDEARTPLIISGQAEESADKYFQFARLVPRLVPRTEGAEEGGDYFIDLKEKAVSPTEEGIDKMERLLGVKNIYDEDPTLARHFESALKAHALFKRDRDYIVKDGEIVIVDEFTGRQMPGRRWSEGLHQAIEAKEGLRVQRENVTLATITFQNYFRLYTKLSGMTGTAMTEAEELHKIYKLEVVAIPTQKPMVRDDEPDLVFRNEQGKYTAVIDEIVEMHEEGRPVLVGTVSVEKSEMLGDMLKRRGIKHEVLNAKFHEKEAPIVAQAGKSGAVTIATNMAGRGTDILLGGNPAGLASEMLHRRGLNPAEVDKETYDEAFAEAKKICDEDHEQVVSVGGLHIIGTERHDSRRIDNQLRGRAGRQGDPGSSRFYLSLEDDLMKRFASDRVAGLMERLGLDEDMAIESRLVSKTIESAQSRVEGYNFDIRKRVVEYDDVISKQRETIYEERDKVLRNEDLTDTIEDFVDQELDVLVDRYLSTDVAPKNWDYVGLEQALIAHGSRRRRSQRGEAVRGRVARGRLAVPQGPGRGEAREEGRGERRGVGAHRASRPAPDDRLHLGRASDRDRRDAPGHRPARLRPGRSTQRLQARGLLPLRRDARLDPPPARDDDLPGFDRAPARADTADRRDGDGRTRRTGRFRGRPKRSGRRLGLRPGRPRPASRTRAAEATSHGSPDRRSEWEFQRRSARRSTAARLLAHRRQDGSQRSVLVRVGAQIQEVPRALSQPDAPVAS